MERENTQMLFEIHIIPTQERTSSYTDCLVSDPVTDGVMSPQRSKSFPAVFIFIDKHWIILTGAYITAAFSTLGLHSEGEVIVFIIRF